MATKPAYDYQTRLNGRGGWEIAEIDAPAGLGIGDYATESDAFATACYNFEKKRIKRGDEPAAKPAPAPRLKPTGLRRLVKALTR